jgi:hypothetical protein
MARLDLRDLHDMRRLCIVRGLRLAFPADQLRAQAQATLPVL